MTVTNGIGRLARTRLRHARPLILAGILSVTFGCGSSTAPAPSAASPPSLSSAPVAPSGPPMLGIDWGRAPSVERPINYEASVAPDYAGTHPILRIAGQAMMSDVTGLPRGGFTAVGYLPPDWQPTAWTSGDGSSWSIHPMTSTDFTFPVALATAADDTVVAVGRSGPRPVAWTTVDGISWQEHQVPVLGSGIAERMTTVVAGPSGLVAGGSVGPELAERRARFWTSADGRGWQAVPDDAEVFANAEVRAIARVTDGFVATGVVGTAQQHTGSVVWTSTDGRRWTRVDDPSLEGGIIAAIVAAPFGGLVGVGSDLGRHEAVVWTSIDGRRWTRAPSEASRQYAGFVWMTDVVVVDDVVIAVGEVQGLQRGTATSWVSRDGLSWKQARTAPVQEQGEFYAITPGGPGAIVVGSFGAPDSYVPTVWLTPAR